MIYQINTYQKYLDKIAKNQKEIGKFNNSTEYFAYPFGKEHTCYNNKTNIILTKLGAKLIFSSNPLVVHLLILITTS